MRLGTLQTLVEVGEAAQTDGERCEEEQERDNG